MKTILKYLCVIIFFGGLFTLYSCDGNNDSDNNDDSDTINDFTEINDENLTFYLIPSPKDMFSFTKKGDLSFSSEVLNPKENADKYIDSKSQELGFGIYSADLAYTASFF